MKYKYYLHRGSLLLLLCLAPFTLIADNYIDLKHSHGFGIDTHKLRLNNVYIETPHPENPEEKTGAHYNVTFEIDFESLHLIPVQVDETCASMEFVVKHEFEGYPIEFVNINTEYQFQQTNRDGFVRFEGLPPRNVKVRFEHEGFNYFEREVELNCQHTVFNEIKLQPLPPKPVAKHIHIELNWGEEPRDLDVHLTGPAPGLEASYKNAHDRFHLYFGSESSDVARLTIDQFSNTKPEVIDIYPPPEHDKLRAGRYCLIAHHFNGAGNLAHSGAQVSVWIDSEHETNHYTYMPPPANDEQLNGENDDVWYAIDLHVNEHGQVDIIPIHTYNKQVNPNVVRCH